MTGDEEPNAPARIYPAPAHAHRTTMNRTLLLAAAAVAVIVAGFAAWFAMHQAEPPPPVVAAPTAPPSAAPEPPAPAIEHPVSEAPLAAGAASEAVPLDHSDAALRPEVAGAFTGQAWPSFLHADRIVRSVVATVDALPRSNVSPTVMPVDPAPGALVVADPGGTPTIGADNDARYAPYVAALQGMNARTAAAVYLKYYPLFQQAYQELGYPHGYFNDRLVSVIDLLLATPDVEGPIKLAQPKVVYVFADPALEALPAGQKIMLRIGRHNADAVKAKLREFRALIARGPTQH
jgi:Protein of unknown function (DUF3014)